MAQPSNKIDDLLSHGLKRCPFCGCNAWMDVRYYVRCEDQTDCGAESPCMDSYAEAADWWNRRA